MMRALWKSMAVAAVLAVGIGIGQAQAGSVYDVTLIPSGFVQTGPFINGAGDRETDLNWSSVSGLPSSELNVGDEVVATINFGSSYTIPASTKQTTFLLFLGPVSGDTATSATTTFKLGGTDVATDGPGRVTTTSTELAAGAWFFPAAAITFDQVIVDFTLPSQVNEGGNEVTFNTGLPATITYGSIDAQAVDYTPEPISTIFFGTGIVGVLGYVARRKMLKQA